MGSISTGWVACAFAVFIAVFPGAARAADDSAGAEVDFRGIQIDKVKRTITFPAAINMTEGALEYLLVSDMGKTHESLLTTKIAPYDIQVAMLLLGIPPAAKADAEPPAQISKDYLAKAPELKGEKIGLTLSWKDAAGGHRIPAEDLIWNTAENKAMSEGPWVYNGSGMYQGRFLAQVDGSIVALVRDSAALMNSPRRGNTDDQIWEVNGKAVPARGTAVDVTVELEQSIAK